MTEEQEKARRTIIKFGNGLLILGLFLGAFGIYFLLLGNETLRWPSVSGELANVMVIRRIDHDPGVGGSARRLDTNYYIRLDYHYEVEGRKYFSSRYSFGDGNVASSRNYDTREEAEAEARKKYDEFKELTVYYDPEDPAEAILKPGWNWGTFAPSLIGLFLIASGWYTRSAIHRAKPTA